MSRNCWTCRRHSFKIGRLCLGKHHPGAAQWGIDHVLPNPAGTLPAMPARETPPCPGWAPRSVVQRILDRLMVRR